jgi:hypothetical protein
MRGNWKDRRPLFACSLLYTKRRGSELKKKGVTAVLACMLLVLPLAMGCPVQVEEPPYTSSITEDILIGMNENDYAKFSKHFDSPMRGALPEAAFKQPDDTIIILPEIKGVIGDYVPGSKEFWRAEEKGGYTVVRYKTQFTGETAEVIVTISFREIGEKIYVSGLWFDSPKLRGK